MRRGLEKPRPERGLGFRVKVLKKSIMRVPFQDSRGVVLNKLG